MPSCHVFVVNERTFPLHLRYRFAGTTPGTGKERHISLLADIARVRKGDKVIFYLERKGFFGVFRVASDEPFLGSGYLDGDLGRNLVYRVRVEPEEVYSDPVSEWEAIDQLPERSRDINWSLLYRKLKGARGCSYLFPQEYERIRALLIGKGKRIHDSQEFHMTYDSENSTIITTEEPYSENYLGTFESPYNHIDFSTETHLQAWLTWHVGRPDTSIPIEMLPRNIDWLANEVYAGSGMQKIDILCLRQAKSSREFILLELKKGILSLGDTLNVVEQIRKYIWWLSDYVLESSDNLRILCVARGFHEDTSLFLKLTEEEREKVAQIRLELWTWSRNKKVGKGYEVSFDKQWEYGL